MIATLFFSFLVLAVASIYFKIGSTPDRYSWENETVQKRKQWQEENYPWITNVCVIILIIVGLFLTTQLDFSPPQHQQGSTGIDVSS